MSATHKDIKRNLNVHIAMQCITSMPSTYAWRLGWITQRLTSNPT